MNRRPNVIFVFLVSLVITLSGLAPERAQGSSLVEKIDSLFVIASSGELRYRDMTDPAMDSIAALGVGAVPHLIDKFLTKSARERWTVIWILQRIGSPAVPDLLTGLKRPEGLVVQRVCWALGDIGDTAAVAGIMAVANHSRWQVRDQAVGALGKIADRRGEPVIISAMSDSIGQVRKAAVVAIGKMKMNDAIDELLLILGDDFYGARMTALNSLMQLDTTAVIEQIAASIDAADNLQASLACRLLGELGGDRAIEILMSQTASADPDRRAHAGMALVTADPTDNCGYHKSFLGEETDRLVRLKIESQLSRVAAAAKDNEP